MSDQLYKDLVEYLGLLAHIVEAEKSLPKIDNELDQAHYAGFLFSHQSALSEIADLLLKAEPNRLETATYQNWDN